MDALIDFNLLKNCGQLTAKPRLRFLVTVLCDRGIYFYFCFLRSLAQLGRRSRTTLLLSKLSDCSACIEGGLSTPDNLVE